MGDALAHQTGLQFVDANGVEAPSNTATDAPHATVTDADIGIGNTNPLQEQGTHMQEVVGVDAPVNPTVTGAVAVQNIVHSLRTTPTLPTTSVVHYRENGLPVPYQCTKSMLGPMLQHNALHVLHIFGTIQAGLCYEDHVQAILEAERRADMLNEEKKMRNKHLLDPNQVLIGRPNDVIGLNVEQRSYLASSFPQSQFTSSDHYGGVEPYPLPNGYRNPSDRWLERVPVAVPDVHDYLALTQQVMNNPDGYVHMESSGCSKPLQVLPCLWIRTHSCLLTSLFNRRMPVCLSSIDGVDRMITSISLARSVYIVLFLFIS